MPPCQCVVRTIKLTWGGLLSYVISLFFPPWGRVERYVHFKHSESISGLISFQGMLVFPLPRSLFLAFPLFLSCSTPPFSRSRLGRAPSPLWRSRLLVSCGRAVVSILEGHSPDEDQGEEGKGEGGGRETRWHTQPDGHSNMQIIGMAISRRLVWHRTAARCTGGRAGRRRVQICAHDGRIGYSG